MIETVTYPITAIVLAVASYTDIKTREVPDWLNYSATACGLAISLIYSFLNATPWPFVYSLAGAAVFFAIGMAMFYTGQWGGGDSKMLIALGALLGLSFGTTWPFINIKQPLIAFFANLLIAGMIYAVIWSAVLAARNYRKFAVHFSQHAATLKSFKLTAAALTLTIITALTVIQDSYIRLMIAGLAALGSLSACMWMLAKAVEKACMIKKVHPKKLTEGDWIAVPVYHKKRYICGPKDLGIEKHQIAQLLKLKIRQVTIKEGIPFIPPFFIAFLLTLKFGNLFMLLII